MGSIFDIFRRNAPKAPAPSPSPAAAAVATAVPNSQQAAQSAAKSNPSLLDSLKARLGLGGNTAAPKRPLGERANEWIEDKIAGASEFIRDNTFGGKSKLFNAGLAAYDKVQNLKDDFKDWKKGVAQRYHNSKFGKAMAGAKDWIKEQASAAGARIKEKFKDDGSPGFFAKAGDSIKSAYKGSALEKGVNAVKGGLSSAGGWIKEQASATASRIKEKFKGDGSPGFFAKAGDRIKSAYKGSALEKGVNAVKGGLSSAGGWIKNKATAAGSWIKEKFKGDGSPGFFAKAGGWLKNKASSAVSWVKDKYEGSALQKGVNMAASTAKGAKEWIEDKQTRWENYKQDFKDQLKAHDDLRYQSHKAEKNGAEYLNELAALKMLLKNGTIASGADEIADPERLLGAKKEEQSKSLSDKINDATKNKHDLILNIADMVADKGGSQLEEKLGDSAGPLSDAMGAAKNAVGIGLRTKEINAIDGMSPEQVTAGVNGEQDKQKMLRARNAMTADLRRKRVEEIGGLAENGAKTIGSLVGGSVGEAAGKAVGSAASKGAEMITDRMRYQDDKKLAKEQIFSSEKDYDAIKHAFPHLSKRDMQIAMAEMTNARNLGDIAERTRYSLGKTVAENKQEGQGGHNLLSAGGFTSKGIAKMSAEDTSEAMGRQQSLDTMRRRTRRNRYI